MPVESTKAPADAGVFSSESDVSTQWNIWWQQARALLYDQLQLVTLEGERVAHSMVALFVSALLVGLLVLTMWFMLLAQIVLFAQQYGVPLAQALALATIANLLGVWLLLRRCRHYSQLLRFPATIRSLHQLTADDKDG